MLGLWLFPVTALWWAHVYRNKFSLHRRTWAHLRLSLLQLWVNLVFVLQLLLTRLTCQLVIGNAFHRLTIIFLTLWQLTYGHFLSLSCSIPVVNRAVFSFFSWIARFYHRTWTGKDPSGLPHGLLFLHHAHGRFPSHRFILLQKIGNR